MEEMAKHPRLYKRGSVFYHRAIVPAELRELYGKREELISLRTRDPREAVKRVRVEAARVDAKFEACREKLNRIRVFEGDAALLSPSQLAQIAEDYYASLLEEDDESRFLGYEDGEKITYRVDKHTDLEKLNAAIAEKFSSKRNLSEHKASLEVVLTKLRDDYAKGDYELTLDMEDWLRSACGITLPKDEVLSKRFAKLLTEGELRALEGALKRSEGEVVLTPSYDTEKTAQALETLSKVAQVWVSEKLLTEAWGTKTVTLHKAVIEEFIGFIGDKPLQAYTKADARRFKELVLTLPANWTKLPELKGLTVEEAKYYALANGLKPMSQKTANGKLTLLHSFWKWSRLHYDEDLKDLFSGLRVKVKQDKRDERHSFSIAQLNHLFSCPVYTGCKSEKHYLVEGHHIPKHSGIYWLPLMGLYSGARMGELAQLYVEDVKTAEGISYLDINDNGPDKSLKTNSSRRRIPLHSELIRLGFLAHVSHCKGQGHKRLFEDITMAKDGHYSSNFSKQFGRWLRQLGLKEDKISFHSFRHNFEDACRNNDVSHSLMNALQGHTEGGMAARYGSGYDLSTLNSAIQNICYEGLNVGL